MNNQEFISYLIPLTKNNIVLQSLLISQICLESAYGKKSFHNNYLGIKKHAGVDSLEANTKEYINGNYGNYKLAFAVYNSITDCIADYLNIMSYTRYTKVREAKNYLEATEQIKNCGYCTSPSYTNSLRKIIEKYKLYELDRINMNYDSLLTENIKYGESWSTDVINGIEVKRQVPPEPEFLEEVIITAEDGQIIRDKLNEVHGTDFSIGYRNRLNEIMLLISSFWRSYKFQRHLKKTKQSTTTKGDHPLGKAIDLITPRGLTPYQFYIFIKDKCNTRFNWFKIYEWGVHCGRR